MMKFLIFFILLIVFVWVAIVPPDGMNKYPAFSVKFEYSGESSDINMSMGLESSDGISGADTDEDGM